MAETEDCAQRAFFLIADVTVMHSVVTRVTGSTAIAIEWRGTGLSVNASRPPSRRMLGTSAVLSSGLECSSYRVSVEVGACWGSKSVVAILSRMFGGLQFLNYSKAAPMRRRSVILSPAWSKLVDTSIKLAR